jgi:hypothetical protein
MNVIKNFFGRNLHAPNKIYRSSRQTTNEETLISEVDLDQPFLL